MIPNSVLTSIIVQTFKISLKLQIDSEKEDGYRHLDILIYAPQNYVGVYFRQRWDLISKDDLEFDDEEDVPKTDKDYVKEATAWERMAFHDSGWTEGLTRILDAFDSRILGVDGSDWFEIVKAPAEM